MNTNGHAMQSAANGGGGGGDDKFVISHSGPMGTPGQKSTAAAYFARSRQQQSLLASAVAASAANENGEDEGEASTLLRFGPLLAKRPPPAPCTLIKKMQKQPTASCGSVVGSTSAVGKVKVIVRVANSGLIDDKRRPASSFFRMDKSKRQVTLFDPSSGNKESSTSAAAPSLPSAPKMFAFDALFTDEDAQAEVCSSALADAVGAVVSGSTDGCVFCYGHAHLGKSYTMVGSDESGNTIGVIPAAIAWLFRCVAERKQNSNSRFSIRASAFEIGGPKEELSDLLTHLPTGEDSSEPPPSAYLPNIAAQKSVSNGKTAPAAIMDKLSEVRCPTADRAGQLLDAALTARGNKEAAGGAEGRDTHFVYTLHVYQYSATPANNGSVAGGRSRLHLIDFGSCERTKTSSGGITLSGLGHVLLGIFNGQRHVPFKESRVTQLLRECLGPLSCQATMIAHVSPAPAHYSETLHTAQLASRIHRMRRRKSGKSSGSSGGGSATGSTGSSDEARKRLGCSSSDFTSSSEQSCDTVIYVGARGDDGEGTDAEHPPVYLPSMNCSDDNRGVMAKALRGSTAELAARSPHSPVKVERRRSAISPHQMTMTGAGTGHSRLKGFANGVSSVGGTPTKYHPSNADPYRVIGCGGSLPRTPKGKMPLCGRVAGYRQMPSPIHRAAARQKRGGGVEAEVDQFYGDGNQEAAAATAALYGYMDDHKKSMIRQWVKCQSEQIKRMSSSSSNGGGGGGANGDCQSNSSGGSGSGRRRQHPRKMPVSPSNSGSSGSGLSTVGGGARPDDASSASVSAAPEPFAWVRDGLAPDCGDCKVLTQFKTASSSSNSSDGSLSSSGGGGGGGGRTISVDVHNGTERRNGRPDNSVPPSPVVSSSSFEGNEGAAGEELLGGEIKGLANCRSFPDGREEEETVRRFEERPLGRFNAAPAGLKGGGESEGASVKPISTAAGGGKAEQEARKSPPPAGGGCRNNPLRNEQEEIEEDEILRVVCSSAPANIETVEEVVLLNGNEASATESSAVLVADSVCQVTEDDLPLPPPPPQAVLEAALSEAATHCSTGSAESDNLSALDAGKLHYVHGVAAAAAAAAKDSREEAYLNQSNLDQLAKLHDLYASVSSISAKSQCHLQQQQEQRDQQNGVGVDGQQHHGGSTFSLGSLVLNGTEMRRAEARKEDGGERTTAGVVSSYCDINSLCSEPVNLWPDGGRKASTAEGGAESSGVTSISLSDLGFFDDRQQPAIGGNAENGRVVPVAASAAADRSDSPVLEGIDRELAKYAKLKNLQQAYSEATSSSRRSVRCGPGEARKERNADQQDEAAAASSPNPDLNYKVTTAATTMMMKKEEEREEDELPETCALRMLASDLTAAAAVAAAGRQNSTESSEPRGETGARSCDLNHGSQQRPTPAPNRNECGRQRQNGKAQVVVTSASAHQKQQQQLKDGGGRESGSGGGKSKQMTDINPASGDVKPTSPSSSPSSTTSNKKAAATKATKIGRLLSRAAGLSRSPKKASARSSSTPPSTPAADSNKSKDSPRKGQRSHSKSSTAADLDQLGVKGGGEREPGNCSSKRRGAGPPQPSVKASLGDNNSSSPLKLADKEPSSLRSGNDGGGSLSRSKNVSGAPPSTNPNSNHHNHHPKKQQVQGKCYIPSPYSFPSAPVSGRKARTADTSSNDSGHDSVNGNGGIGGNGESSSSSPSVRMRGGRGAAAGAAKVSRAEHCQSSGYESCFGVEADERPPAEDAKIVELTLGRGLNYLEPLELQSYTDDRVSRMDSRWRCDAVKAIRKEQESLKEEMATAKERIGSDPSRWSFDLHVGGQAGGSLFGPDPDPSCVQAFARETQILGKRVDACKAHVSLVTCFDVEAAAASKNECCTTECQPAQCILMETNTSCCETDII